MTAATLVTADQAAGHYGVAEEFVINLAKQDLIEVVGSFRLAGRAVPLFRSADIAKHVPKRVD